MVAPERALPCRVGESRHRSRAVSAVLQFVLSTSLVAAPAGCSWAHPGANPYRGDPVHALADFDLPEATRAKLRTLMAEHRYTDVATITRDDIVGASGYTDLREMHSGRGQVCRGSVDRSAWSPARRERGLVYCADDACVIVPTICNNVSLVSRKPDRAAALDEGPIDIEPAAGPPPPPADTFAATPSDAMSPQDFIPIPGGGLPDLPESPGGGNGGGGSASGGNPVGGGGGGGGPVGSGPIGGGGSDCCDIGPIGPTSPGTPPITPPSAVPEAPVWMLLLAGLASIFGCRPSRR